MRKTKVAIKNIAIDLLETNIVQPPWRTNGKKSISMEALVDSIREDGQIAPVLVAELKGRFFLIDGHRRTEAHRTLGLPKIRCTTVTVNSLEEVENLFAKVDRLTLKLSAADRFYGWAKATNRTEYLNSISDASRRLILDMIDIYGDKEAAKLAEAKVTPSLARVSKAVCRFVFQKYILKAGGEALDDKTCAEWVRKHKGAEIYFRNLLNDTKKGDKAKAGVLYRKIVNNRPPHERVQNLK